MQEASNSVLHNGFNNVSKAQNSDGRVHFEYIYLSLHGYVLVGQVILITTEHNTTFRICSYTRSYSGLLKYNTFCLKKKGHHVNGSFKISGGQKAG